MTTLDKTLKPYYIHIHPKTRGTKYDYYIATDADWRYGLNAQYPERGSVVKGSSNFLTLTKLKANHAIAKLVRAQRRIKRRTKNSIMIERRKRI